MHFDLIDLRLYLHVLDAGNITAGASRSHLSLAAASARIRAMEAALGVECLERGRRGVTPTAAGQALARHARLLLQQAEHLQQDLAEYANGVKGQVRLLCNTTALSEYLPELLAAFAYGPLAGVAVQPGGRHVTQVQRAVGAQHQCVSRWHSPNLQVLFCRCG